MAIRKLHFVFISRNEPAIIRESRPYDEKQKSWRCIGKCTDIDVYDCDPATAKIGSYNFDPRKRRAEINGQDGKVFVSFDKAEVESYLSKITSRE